MFKNLMTKIKGVLAKMGLIKSIKSASNIRNVPDNDEFYENIAMWKNLYRGYHPSWHDVTYSTLGGQKKRKMHTLNMPKVVSQELATLIFNERCNISISDDGLSEYITEVLDNNKFFRKFQHYLEYMYAIGGMVIKPYYDNGQIKLSYVTADCFIPISWNNNRITEAIFSNQIIRGKDYYTHLEWHLWEDGKYVVRNELYLSKNSGELGHKISLATLYENLKEEIFIEGIEKPMFIYIAPNTANHIDLDSPLGVPIYAHALDTIKSLDKAFDSFEREFRLGKRRILVPASAVRAVPDEHGVMQRYFDVNDEVYEAMNTGGGIDDNKIVDNSVELRVEEHISAINALLNILSMQIGFSAGTFSFDGQGIKTATEVVSENSKTFRTKQSHEIIIEEALSDLVDIIVQYAELYNLYNAPNEWNLTVTFDDSIAEDKTAEVDREILLVSSGLQSKVRALMKIHGITEEEAEELIEEINTENSTATAQSVDFFGGYDRQRRRTNFGMMNQETNQEQTEPLIDDVE